MKQTGLLLINTGTPSDNTVPAVRKYLREFLSDPRVIDIPAIARWILLNVFILPFRHLMPANFLYRVCRFLLRFLNNLQQKTDRPPRCF